MDKTDNRLPDSLIDELTRALSNMSFGSIELFVQDKVVTQITIRNIKKTSVNIKHTKKMSNINISPIKNRISASGKLQIKLRP